MIIKYFCKNCQKKRFLTKLSSTDVICPNCNSIMELEKDNITIEMNSTEEDRFIADEALFNTVGARVTGRHENMHLTKESL